MNVKKIECLKLFKKIGSLVIILLFLSCLFLSCTPKVVTVNYDADLSIPINFHLKNPVKIGIFPFTDLRLKEASKIGSLSLSYIPIRYFYIPEDSSQFIGTTLKKMFLFSGFNVTDKTKEKITPDEFIIYKFIKDNKDDIDFAIYGQIIKLWVKSNWLSKVEVRIHLYLLDVKKEKIAWSGDIYFSDYGSPLFLKSGSYYLLASNLLTSSLNKAFENLFSNPTFKGLFRGSSM